jgi:hypothetical protein
MIVSACLIKFHLRGYRFANPRAAEDHQGGLHAAFRQREFGLEQFKLDPDTACLRPLQQSLSA